MSEHLILREAKRNNNIITFKKKDENGLELWYTGTVKDVEEYSFNFNSIYGNDYSFDIKEIIDLKGPKIAHFDESLSGDVFNMKRSLKYLIFDTETTGLPKNWKAEVTDTDNWPRVIQFAWSIHDDSGKELEHQDLLIKPEGFFIPEETTKIHGITQEKADNEGMPLKDALNIFKKAIANVDVLVAHNISFDEMVVGCEFYRANMPDPIPKKEKICTKEASVDFCKIPGRGGRYRLASLNDLYRILFSKTFDNQHNASSDVKACAMCFFELKRIGVVG